MPQRRSQNRPGAVEIDDDGNRGHFFSNRLETPVNTGLPLSNRKYIGYRANRVPDRRLATESQRRRAIADLMSVDAVKPASATFVFADIAGLHRADRGTWRRRSCSGRRRFLRSRSRAQLPARGGTQVKTIGDALMLRIPDPGAAILLGLRITHALTRRLFAGRPYRR